MKNLLNKFIYFQITLIILFTIPIIKNQYALASNILINTWNTIENGYDIASHVSLIDNDRVYVIAGATNNSTSNIVYADLNEDGTVSEWTYSENDFPIATFYNTITNYKDRYYIVGGVDSLNQNSISNIYISDPGKEIRDNWILSQVTLPETLFSGGATTINNNLYYIGGANKDNGNTIFKNSVYINNLQIDGSLNTSWNTTLPLKDEQPWVGFEPVFTGSRIILIGGKDKHNVATNKVYEGVVNENTGEIESWQETHPLPTDEYVAYNSVKVVKIGKYILAVGGTVWDSEYNRTNSNLVFYTEINHDGSIGPWSKSLHSLPQNTCCGSLVFNNDYLYYMGGFSTDLGGYHDKIFYTNHNISNDTLDKILNVDYQSQLNPEWTDFEYDNASRWFSPNPSIGRWGCALTSASMVLNYYNHNTNPKLLNDWLVSQPDGYIRNGLINWLAISRYSKLHKNNDNSTLEFRRYSADDSILQNEVNNNRPSIVKVPGHFVVVKGLTENEFYINDPTSLDRILLSQVEEYYDNSYSQINSYSPSETDLSYIMLVINESHEIYVYDTADNLIENDLFVDEPIVDEISKNKLNNQTLNVYLYPKPLLGTYRLNIVGERDYNLDAYLYDNNGNVTIEKLNGYNNQKGSKIYKIYLGSENSFLMPESALDIFKHLERSMINKCKHSSRLERFRCNNIYRLLRRAHMYYKSGNIIISKLIIRFTIRYLSVYSLRLNDNYYQLLQYKLQLLYKSI